MAARIAVKLFATGILAPLSKSLTVLSPTFALNARSFCVQSSHPRAALDCSGDIGSFD